MFVNSTHLEIIMTMLHIKRPLLFLLNIQRAWCLIIFLKAKDKIYNGINNNSSCFFFGKLSLILIIILYTKIVSFFYIAFTFNYALK